MRIHSDARCDPAYFEFSPIESFKWLNDHSNRDAGYMLKVAIIEDHRELRDYLVALIGGAEGLYRQL